MLEYLFVYIYQYVFIYVRMCSGDGLGKHGTGRIKPIETGQALPPVII